MTAAFDLFFYEAFEEEQEALRRYAGTRFRAGYTAQTIQEAGHATPPAPIISLRTQSVIPVDWAPALRAILSRSAGYNHLSEYLQRTGRPVVCGYLPEYCVRAVAEQALLLWLALLRKLPQQVRQMAAFHRDGITGRETLEKTLLVVGVGHIGHQVVELGRALGMTVLGVDVAPRYADVRYVSFDQGLPAADIVVCAMNLTPDNVAYFSYERMQAAQPGCLFINIARGEMSPCADLLRLLRAGILGGVGLDVLNREHDFAVWLRAGRTQPDAEFEALLALREMENVIITPHNAFNTREAVERKAAQSVDQAERFLAKGTFLWPIPEVG